MQSKLRWTAEEEEALFEKARTLPEMPWYDIWPKAQVVLPQARQRQFNNSSMVSYVTKKYRVWLEKKKRAEQRAIAKEHQQQQEAAPEPHSEIRTSEPSPAPGPDIIVVEKVVIQKEEPDYGVIPTVVLARILLERLALMEQLDNRIAEIERAFQMKRQAETQHDVRLGPAPAPKVEPKPEKIRIAIVGPLDSQAREIESRLVTTPKPIELRFYDKDQQTQRPIGIVHFAIVTRHCNHAWWDKMKAVLPADRVFFVDSGIQSVVQKVYDICARRDT